jgi:hypothetical protein
VAERFIQRLTGRPRPQRGADPQRLARRQGRADRLLPAGEKAPAAPGGGDMDF